MRRLALLWIVATLGLVAGCGGKPSPTPSPTAVPPTVTTAPVIAPTVVTTPSGPATCTAMPLDFPVDPNIPPVTGEDHVRGPAGAPITLIEYSDFQ